MKPWVLPQSYAHTMKLLLSTLVVCNISFYYTCFQRRGSARQDVTDKMLDYLRSSRFYVCLFVCVCRDICPSDLLRAHKPSFRAPCITASVLIYGSSSLCANSPSLGDLGRLIRMYGVWLPWKHCLVLGAVETKMGAPAVHAWRGSLSLTAYRRMARKDMQLE